MNSLCWSVLWTTRCAASIWRCMHAGNAFNTQRSYHKTVPTKAGAATCSKLADDQSITWTNRWRIHITPWEHITLRLISQMRRQFGCTASRPPAESRYQSIGGAFCHASSPLAAGTSRRPVVRSQAIYRKKSCSYLLPTWHRQLEKPCNFDCPFFIAWLLSNVTRAFKTDSDSSCISVALKKQHWTKTIG